MKSFLRRVNGMLSHHGLNLLALPSLRHFPIFFLDAWRYRRLTWGEALPLRWSNLFPILNERSGNAGTTTSHYFIMDLWMARRLLAAKPEQHVDIASRLDGFVAHLLASGLTVTQVDIRPLPNLPEGLLFLQDDATLLRKVPDGSLPSLSSLHAAEHFGLGRYGDAIDPLACFTFMRNLARVVANRGRLYFAVPVGRERVHFNAHRVFDPRRVEELFREAGLRVEERAVITAEGVLTENANWCDHLADEEACGLWIFSK
ncbi:MAG: hypothetical protein QOJ96_1588 [Alphaproteobacteria bacterium]|jgi:hypothetical protein|nr:hypothetical protein [Alphaproteobacteria bacterium]